MNTLTEKVIMIAKPRILFLGFAIFGTIFFGALTSMMLPTSKWKVADGTDYMTGMIIMWILLGVFIFFSVSCFIMLLSMKSIILTDKNLIIKRPLLMLKLTIPLTNIKNVVNEDYQINSSHKGTTFNVHNGEQTIVEFENSRKKKVKFNSFEVSNYDNLELRIKQLLRNNKKMKLTDHQSVNKQEGYGWLIFLVIVTLCLVYFIIKKKFL